MIKKMLGNTGLMLSQIGLGTWAIGGGGWRYAWGPQDDKDSIATIRRALELGINWIDTAPIYGFGHSEEIVGKAIKEVSAKPFIATKCGLLWDDKRRIIHCLKKDSIKKEVEASIRRLKVEVIDLYQIHWPIPDEEIEEAWAVMQDLIKEGKIRYAGVSNFGVGHIKKIKSLGLPISIQVPYSLIKNDIEKEIISFCKESNISILVYGTLAKGLLTGKFTKQNIQNLPMDDHRKRDTEFIEPQLSKNLELVEDVKEKARRENKTPPQYAISWVLNNQDIYSAIVGARTPKQIEENLL